jgi:oxygen-independent coproporphyrinogen-3 oxidase
LADLGLYIHVPFCRCKCDWCAFASEPGTPDPGPWLDRILGQLDQPPLADARWATVYLGGGTPSLLAPPDLDLLLTRVGDRLVPGAEVTMEANPESLTAEHLAVLGSRGATRLSLGIQTFDETILARHGRPTRRRHLDAARALVAGWSGSLSLDLICGLEGQTEAGQRRDVDEALDWNPDHLSFYSLTVEPGTPLARRVRHQGAALPADDVAAQWWLDGRDRLEADGLVAYEVSNFARPGAESVHNGRYWSLEPWWGLGPSATSLLPRLDPHTAGFEYRTEPGRLSDWLAGRRPEVEVPSRLDGAKDALLAGLRRTKGVDAHPWVDLLAPTLARWTGHRVENGRLFLTRQAFPFLDAFLRDAFTDLDERPEYR